MKLKLYSWEIHIWSALFTQTKNTVGGICLCVSLILSGCATYSKTDSTLGATFWYEIVGWKKCRVWGHEHTGTGTSSRLGNLGQAEALNLAIQNWNWFTQGEYGANWTWESANTKNVSCTSISWGEFRCDIGANPCRIGN